MKKTNIILSDDHDQSLDPDFAIPSDHEYAGEQSADEDEIVANEENILDENIDVSPQENSNPFITMVKI